MKASALKKYYLYAVAVPNIFIYFAPIKLLHSIHSSKHQKSGTNITLMSSKFAITMATCVCDIFILNF